MNEFIVQNPGVVSILIGILLSIVGWFVRDAFQKLTAAIKSLHETINGSIKDIGILKDRMQKQETTCEMQRAQCPARTVIFPTSRHMGREPDNQD